MVMRAHLQSLLNEIEILRMKEGGRVYDYFSQAFTIANLMITKGEHIYG